MAGNDCVLVTDISGEDMQQRRGTRMLGGKTRPSLMRSPVGLDEMPSARLSWKVRPFLALIRP